MRVTPGCWSRRCWPGSTRTSTWSWPRTGRSYLATPGTGWEPLLRYGTTTIRDKVLFGTGWFLLGRPPGQIVDEFRALPVAEDVLEMWLWRNAEALLGAGVAV